MRTDPSELLAMASGVLVVACACATWRVWPHAKRLGTDACAGVGFAAGASAPWVLLWIAGGALLLLNRLTGGWPELLRAPIVFACVGIVASPALVVMSFGVAPIRSMPLRLECVRLVWTLVWIVESWLAASTIAAI